MFTVRSCFHSLRLIGKSEIIKIAYGKKITGYLPLFTSVHLQALKKLFLTICFRVLSEKLFFPHIFSEISLMIAGMIFVIFLTIVLV